MKNNEHFFTCVQHPAQDLSDCSQVFVPTSIKLLMNQEEKAEMAFLEGSSLGEKG